MIDTQELVSTTPVVGVEDVVHDPFEARQGVTARLARRLGCTEGQLYSLAIGALLLTTVSVNALPKVQWDSGPLASGAGFLSDGQSPATAAPLTEAPVVVPGPGPLAPFEVPGLGFGDGLPLPNPLAEQPEPFDPAPTPAEFTPAEFPTAEPSVAAGPLQVDDGGFASATAGTPLATLGVPEGSVAVALQAGQLDKVTYLQLSGMGTLSLAVDPNGGNRLEALAAIQLCPAAPGAIVGRGDVTPQEAPQYDCAKTVKGVRDPAGTGYTFDLKGLTAQQASSVAILPVSGTLSDFQIVFRLALG